ncbi:MAG: alanine racemase [Deltaproteobacteria bacterium]|nr:alanine racemase [Deltaproteobacteria bacterium]
MSARRDGPAPTETRQRVAALDDTLIDDTHKGWPATRAPARLGELGRLGLDLLRGDLCLPVAVLKERALDNNARWLRVFLDATGATLAPHGKTTMSPQLFLRQLDDGAWGITVATVHQLQVCRRFGVPRLLLANQLVDDAALAVVVAELAKDEGFEVVALADSLEGVRKAAAAARAGGLHRPLRLMVEVGFAGGRTGCRGREQALDVARAIADDSALALVGVEGFEGLIHSSDVEADVRAVCSFLDEVVGVARAAAAEGLFAPGPVLLSAGGSAYYDLVAERLGKSGVDGAQVLLRAGCYLTHDAAVYAGAHADARRRLAAQHHVPGELVPALELLAVVLSRPERERAILGLGKRDVGNDYGPPVVLAMSSAGAPPAPLAAHVVVELNDQHAHLRVPADSPLAVGDVVLLGISHPCTTFDKWRVLFTVDDRYRVLGAVRTFF